MSGASREKTGRCEHWCRGCHDAAKAQHTAAISRVVALLLRRRFALVRATVRAADPVDRVQGREHGEYRHGQKPAHESIIACFRSNRAGTHRTTSNPSIAVRCPVDVSCARRAPEGSSRQTRRKPHDLDNLGRISRVRSRTGFGRPVRPGYDVARRGGCRSYANGYTRWLPAPIIVLRSRLLSTPFGAV